MLRTLVVIVNYRTADLTIDCLRSLAAERQQFADFRVAVVDGASGDDSCPKLAAAIQQHVWADWVTLQAAPENRGFAAGNNYAIQQALTGEQRPEYILLLNPDTIVHPGGIEKLVAFLDRHADVGIVGSRLENRDGSAQCSAFRFHTIWGEIDSGARLGLISRLLAKHVVAPPVSPIPVETDWVCGASMLVRRAVFDDVGLLDDGYFMYFEEVDFCYRARQAGWKCWYEPASRVIHLVGQASGMGQANQGPRRLPAYWFESRRRYFVKNHGRLYAALADLGWILTHLTWRVRAVVQRKPKLDPPYLLTDFVRHSPFAACVPCRCLSS